MTPLLAGAAICLTLIILGVILYSLLSCVGTSCSDSHSLPKTDPLNLNVSQGIHCIIYFVTSIIPPEAESSTTARASVPSSPESSQETATTTSFVYYPGKVKREADRQHSRDQQIFSEDYLLPLAVLACLATSSLVFVTLYLI